MADGRAARPGGGDALIRSGEPGRRARLRPLQRHPQSGVRGDRKRDAAKQPGGRRHQGTGGPLQGKDRPDVLLRLFGRAHRERPEHLLRPTRPVPRRRPRPLRLPLPPAHLDAALLGARYQRQARRLPEGPAEAGCRDQARRLAADRLGETPRDRGCDDDPRRPAGLGAGRLRPLDDVSQGRQRQGRERPRSRRTRRPWGRRTRPRWSGRRAREARGWGRRRLGICLDMPHARSVAARAGMLHRLSRPGRAGSGCRGRSPSCPSRRRRPPEA